MGTAEWSLVILAVLVVTFWGLHEGALLVMWISHKHQPGLLRVRAKVVNKKYVEPSVGQWSMYYCRAFAPHLVNYFNNPGRYLVELEYQDVRGQVDDLQCFEKAKVGGTVEVFLGHRGKQRQAYFVPVDQSIWDAEDEKSDK